MLLHRYFSSHALETLRTAKLKTSRISSFNDSFEFLFVSVGRTTPDEAQRYLDSKLCDPVLVFDLVRANQNTARPSGDETLKRRLNESAHLLKGDVVKVWPGIVKKTQLSIERRRQIVDNELRAICFSDPSRVKQTDEILLWSHYANRHRGIRIGFEFPEECNDQFEIKAITYQNNRPEVIWSLEGEAATLSALEQSATVKCQAWQYEQEARLLTKTTLCKAREVKNCDSTITVEYFLDFQKAWVKSVDFGVFFPPSEIQPVVDLLKTDFPNATARKAEFHETEYALDYKCIEG